MSVANASHRTSDVKQTIDPHHNRVDIGLTTALEEVEEQVVRFNVDISTVHPTPLSILQLQDAYTSHALGPVIAHVLDLLDSHAMFGERLVAEGRELVGGE